MRKSGILFCFIITAICAFAQPQKIKYQGVARNSSGNALVNQLISFRISIKKDSAAGAVVYKETHSTTTNQFGLFYINIGTGSVVAGTFSSIPWGKSDYYQETEMDPTGGASYTSMGISQFLSVPYALYAKNGGSSGYRATNSSSQAVGPNSSVTVSFNVENFDDGDNFSSNVFTAPSDGFYNLEATVVWDVSAYTQTITAPTNTITNTTTVPVTLSGFSIEARLVVGSIIYDIASMNSVPRAVSEAFPLKLSTNIYLTAGQTVHVEAFNASNTTSQTLLGSYCHFSGYKIY